MDEILGFKLFLEKTEKYAISNKAPKLTMQINEKFLSYALALDVDAKRSSHFTDQLYQPEWYTGTYWTNK